MSSELTDRVVFLTGGAQGIGRECALAYARAGAYVVVADIQFAEAERTVADLGHKSGLAVECDVSSAASVEAAVKAALKRYDSIHVVHNNAGISSPTRPLHETTEKEWDRLHAVNLKSVYLTTYFALESLKSSRGCILNTASLVGQIGQADHAAYVSTKGAVIALTKAMALDYARYGIRVNAICPAGVWTPLLHEWVSMQPNPAQMEQYLNDIHALGYCPQGDVIADVAVFLASDRARFMTGAIVPVSGGAELGYRR
jgi:meso-butanediol dehydrogenase/(S,S)-butanediol dehydrogenase/diacetyl reductase